MRVLLMSSTEFLEWSLILAMLVPWSCYGDLITTTCDQTPNDNLCISILKKDPRSRKSDVMGLSLIMIEATNEKAKSMVDQINKVGELSSSVKNELMECRENYKVILKSDIPKTIDFLKRNEKFAAERLMAASAMEADGCEKSILSSKNITITISTTQLIGMNKSVYELSAIARSIIRAMINGIF